MENWKIITDFIKNPLPDETIEQLKKTNQLIYIENYVHLNYATVRTNIHRKKYYGIHDYSYIIDLAISNDIMFPFHKLPVDLWKKNTLTVTTSDKVIKKNGAKKGSWISPKLQTAILMYSIEKAILEEVKHLSTENHIIQKNSKMESIDWSTDNLRDILSPLLKPKTQYENEYPSRRKSYDKWISDTLKPITDYGQSLTDFVEKNESDLSNITTRVSPAVVRIIKKDNAKRLQKIFEDILKVHDFSTEKIKDLSSSDEDTFKLMNLASIPTNTPEEKAIFIKRVLNSVIDELILDQRKNRSQLSELFFK